MQRVLVLYTASRATWASALPSSAAKVEKKEGPGNHAKGQEVLLCLEYAGLHTGCPVQKVTSPNSLYSSLSWEGRCYGVKGTVIPAF